MSDIDLSDDGDDRDRREGYEALRDALKDEDLTPIDGVHLELPASGETVPVDSVHHSYTPPLPEDKGGVWVWSTPENSVDVELKACSRHIPTLMEIFDCRENVILVYETAEGEIAIDDEFYITDISHTDHGTDLGTVSFCLDGGP